MFRLQLNDWLVCRRLRPSFLLEGDDGFRRSPLLRFRSCGLPKRLLSVGRRSLPYLRETFATGSAKRELGFVVGTTIFAGEHARRGTRGRLRVKRERAAGAKLRRHPKSAASHGGTYAPDRRPPDVLDSPRSSLGPDLELELERPVVSEPERPVVARGVDERREQHRLIAGASS